MTKVSVIIPNYNHAPYLPQRIETVLHQLYQNFEVIILDDCSQDNSREIIDQYRDHPKVSHIVYNEQNSGSTFKQWKKGIELAKGEWIWIAESDDWCEPTFLTTLTADINDKSAIAFAQSLVCLNDVVLWNSQAKRLEETVSGDDFIRNQMLEGNDIVNASMCIFKKELFYTIDDSFTQYKFCGDWLFWIEIARQGNVFISGKILNYFRKHDKDVSDNATKKGLFYNEYFMLLDELEKKGIINDAEKKSLLQKKFLIFLRDERLEKEVKEDIKNSFVQKIKRKAFPIIVRSKILQLRFKTSTLLRRL